MPVLDEPKGAMFLANLSKREKTLFYLTVAVISLSLLFNFAFRPVATAWSRLNRQILDKEIKLKKNIRYLTQKNEIAGIFQDYTGFMNKGRAPDEEEVTALLNEVERQARDAQIHINNIRPKPTKLFNFYTKYILELSCEASIADCIKFIYNLQKSAQLVRVETLKLTSMGKDTPLLRVQMLITKVLITDWPGPLHSLPYYLPSLSTFQACYKFYYYIRL